MRRPLVLVLALLAPWPARPAHAEWDPLPPPPVVISAPRADVWAALTTAEGIVTTDGGQAIVDLRLGGSIRRHPDPNAGVGDAGWTSRTVLAFAPPRLLLLADDTPTTWTALELDALDGLRTRLRVEHVGVVAYSQAALAAEAADRALVVRLEKRFPKRPDPVVTAFTALAGTWEERRDGKPDAEREVLARWTIAVEPGDEAADAPPSVALERASPTGERIERWVYWREAQTGRWIGGLVDGAGIAAYELTPYASGGIGWSCLRSLPGPEAISIEALPRDGVVDVDRVYGCIGEGFRWTRTAVAK